LSVGHFVFIEKLDTESLAHVLVINDKCKMRTSGACASNGSQDDANSSVVKRRHLPHIHG
jgi:hypothetical protein